MKAKYVRSATWVQDQGSSNWLQNDPRSATAMLRGRGDGRHTLYEQFAKIRRLECSSILTEQIDQEYATYIRDWEAARNRSFLLLAPFRAIFAAVRSSFAVRLLQVVSLVWAIHWLAMRF
jgi:hypothetical protein